MDFITRKKIIDDLILLVPVVLSHIKYDGPGDQCAVWANETDCVAVHPGATFVIQWGGFDGMGVTERQTKFRDALMRLFPEEGKRVGTVYMYGRKENPTMITMVEEGEREFDYEPDGIYTLTAPGVSSKE